MQPCRSQSRFVADSMKTIARALFIASVALAILVCAKCFCPSLWVKDRSIDSATHAHMAGLTTADPRQAAYEALFWQVHPNDRPPFSDLSLKASFIEPNQWLLCVTENCADDSISQVYHQIFLVRSGGSWSLIRLQSCWKARNLFGWSTDTPS